MVVNEVELHSLKLRQLNTCHRMLMATVEALDRVRNVEHRSAVEQAELEFLLEIRRPIEAKYAEVWESIEV